MRAIATLGTRYEVVEGTNQRLWAFFLADRDHMIQQRTATVVHKSPLGRFPGLFSLASDKRELE